MVPPGTDGGTPGVRSVRPGTGSVLERPGPGRSRARAGVSRAALRRDRYDVGSMSITPDPRPQGPTGPPRDRLGRLPRDLRISVTDRCNFRCTYCMPAEMFGRDFAFLPRSEILRYEEIARLAGIFVASRRGEAPDHRRRADGAPRPAGPGPPAGRDRGRATTSRLPPTDRCSGRWPPRCADAGLQRVTVSLDSLDDAVFRAMSGVDMPVARVLDGIAAARAAGLAPVKINMVVRRGVNEASIVPMARWARDAGFILRYIEYMDVGTANGWRLDDVVPARGDHRARRRGVPARGAATELPGRGRDSLPLPRRCGRDRRDRVGDGAVLRRLHPRAALGRGRAVHLPLRGARDGPAGAAAGRRTDDAGLEALIRAAWAPADDRYSEVRSARTVHLPRVEMFAIGG